MLSSYLRTIVSFGAQKLFSDIKRRILIGGLEH